MVTLYEADQDQLAEILDGEPAYRTRQVWRNLYVGLRQASEMTDLPRGLRHDLESQLPLALTPVTESVSDGGDTVKLLWELADGHRIETVLMYYPDRVTVCVSSQAGCAMACGFCATGQAGFERHLDTGEIVEQVIRAARRAADEERRLSNVVFMGMGEPLANYERVVASVRRLHTDLGLSARNLTISTVGVVPGIRRLAAEDLPVTLAVSLHAADDATRDELVPLNRRYPLAALAEACAEWRASRNRRLSVEWAMIADTNDSAEQADLLAGWARPLGAHVNLIPLNPTPGWPTRGSAPATITAFRDRLRGHGVNATIRRNRGTDIDAACGQLAAAQPVAVSVGRRPDPPAPTADAAPQSSTDTL